MASAKIATFFVLLCTIVHLTMAYFENCDYVVNLLGDEGTSIVSPGAFLIFLHYFGYVGYYRPGTSCRYRIQVPQHYAVQLKCDIDIAITGTNGTCITEQLRLLTDGTDDILNRGQFYCGYGRVSYTSRINSLTFGYLSKSYGGKFNCTVIGVWNG